MVYYHDIGVIKRKITLASLLLIAGIFTFLATFGVFVNANAASTVAVYNSAPSPLPSNLPSLGFQATQAAEVGARVVLTTGSSRVLDSATVTMSSWACQSGAWESGNCSSAQGATFKHPITFSIYKVDSAGVVGDVVKTVTKEFDIPYRPSADPDCTGGRWQDATGACFNGYAFNINFGLESVTVPNELVYGVAFNTNTWGYDPIGANGPYESLNVGLVSSATDVTAGTLVDSYWASGSSPIFEAMGEWQYTPAVSLNAQNNPKTKDECKKDGWQKFGFKNQGLCIQYVNTGKDSRN
jgi:hypothetical protein